MKQHPGLALQVVLEGKLMNYSRSVKHITCYWLFCALMILLPMASYQACWLGWGYILHASIFKKNKLSLFLLTVPKNSTIH